MKIIPKTTIGLFIAIILIAAAAVAVLYYVDNDFVIPDHPTSVLREYGYYENGPSTGISYAERGQVFEVGCVGPDSGFMLDYIRLRGGFMIGQPYGTFYLRVYSIGGSGLPDILLSETPVCFCSLPMVYGDGWQWFTLSLDEPLELEGGGRYAVTWVWPEYTPGGPHLSLCISDIGETTSYLCGDGVVLNPYPGSSWGFLDNDFVFEVYGYES